MFGIKVFVPYRGFYFLNMFRDPEEEGYIDCFRPLSGLLFS